MTKYYTLGEDIYFEISGENHFLYIFAEKSLKTRLQVEENHLALGEETNVLDYKRLLNSRVYKFIKSFKK